MKKGGRRENSRGEEAYRSGHNEAVLKTVRVQAHGGSNPSASAKCKKHTFSCVFCIFTTKSEEGFERADRRQRKNTKKTAVVIDSIVCCQTAQACRKAEALVRGNPSDSAKKNTLKRKLLIFLLEKIKLLCITLFRLNITV